MFGVVEIMEVLLDVEGLLVSSEWRQFWVGQEFLEVAELVSLLVLDGINLILVLLSLNELLIVSFQEWEDSLDVVLLDELWEIEHHHLLVFNAVQFENVV